MGEMADYYLERAFDELFEGENADPEDADLGQAAPICRHCQQTVRWVKDGQTKSGWSLYNADNTRHACPGIVQAGVAQLAVRRTRNAEIAGSIPAISSKT